MEVIDDCFVLFGGILSFLDKGKQKKSAKSTEFLLNMPFAQHNRGFATSFSATSSLRREAMVGGALARASASALRVNLNLDGAPIASNSHTHPSYSQTSRLLTSSLSLGVPVPRPTQCMGGA